MELHDLDRRRVVPLYYRIHQHLLKGIRSGRLRPARLLPSEETISKRLRVGRMTARHALKSLWGLGVAHTKRVGGTFVSEIKVEKDIRDLQSFTEKMEAWGSRPHLELVAAEVILARSSGFAPVRIYGTFESGSDLPAGGALSGHAGQV